MPEVTISHRRSEGILEFIQVYPYLGAAILVALIALIYFVFKR